MKVTDWNRIGLLVTHRPCGPDGDHLIPDSYETTLAVFLANNDGEFAEDEIIEIGNLPLGESISFGGGAAPITTITRI